MNTIKKGSIVYKKSQSENVIYIVDKIIKNTNCTVAVLKGLIERVLNYSSIEDLELVDKNIINEKFGALESKINARINSYCDLKKFTHNKRFQETIITGKILHLDGDKRYSQKSYNYYKKIGLDAVVRNIPEYKQPKLVYNLLKLYTPDILIITGHDEMIHKNKNYNDLNNYRNSRYFINSVIEARKYDNDFDNNLVIFAGACQSYFEGLIMAGANFASSPARILIDFLDPLIIAEKVATTEKNKYINIDDIETELRDGKKGIDGIGANGKMHKILK